MASLSQQTLDKITKALADRDSASVANDADTAAIAAREAAIQNELNKKSSALDAATAATDSAHEALAAIQLEFSLSQPTPPAPVIPPNPPISPAPTA